MAGAQNQIGQNQMEEMLSIGEAADFIGVSVDTLRRWSKKERVTTYRSPGGHRYYKKKDLVDLFDAKYTRDEPTERSSKEDEDEQKEKTTETEETKEAQKVKHEQQAEVDEIEELTIPKMQPVRVISDLQDYQTQPLPDLSPPPPPPPAMPMTQTHTHVEVQTVSVDQTKTSVPKSYRQPAIPIKKEDESQKNGDKTSLHSTVISDYTTGGGYADERQTVDTTTPTTKDKQKDAAPTTQPQHAEETQPIQEHKNERSLPPTPEPIVEDTPIAETTQEPEKKQHDIKETASPIEQPSEQPPSDRIKQNEMDSEKEEESEMDVKFTATKEGMLLPEKEEIEKIRKVQTEQKKKEMQQSSEPKKHEQSEQTNETKIQKQDVAKTVVDKQQKAEVAEKDKQSVKSKTTQTSPQKDSKQQPPQEKIETPTAPEEKKNSILEPEGVDASKLNQIEKMDEESWLTRNKSNILIGFTVFLLIDIILFIIWLTTSRILSPIP